VPAATLLLMTPIKMRIHEVPPAESHSGDTLLATQFTQRAINRDYRTETGKYADSEYPPELDGSTRMSKIPPMMTFENFYGHFAPYSDPSKDESERKELVTRVFAPTEHVTYALWRKYITSMCIASINKSCRDEKDRYCWDVSGTEMISMPTILSSSSPYPELYKRYVRTQQKAQNRPLSVHTVQAWLESSRKRGKTSSLFSMVSVSTTMTSIAGGINNNCTIEMGFKEKEGTKDLDKRAYDMKYFGTVCIGSTPHNADAGKVRRLVSDSRARVLSCMPLWSLDESLTDQERTRDWCVHCMGSVFLSSLEFVKVLVQSMKDGLRLYYESQFNYPNHYYLPVPPTFIVYHKSKILDISIAPGVVVSNTGNKEMMDSSMISLQKAGKIVSPPKIEVEGADAVGNTRNPYYLFFTYPNEDQQPRPIFANSQTVQCQGLPWGPANARISPNHVSNPLIGTKFARMVELDHVNNDEAIWDKEPGEDVVVCFMALPDNYEDSIIISQRFADMGGFSSTSVVPVRLREKDLVPEVGEIVCGKKYKWWKVDCTPSCVCKKKKLFNTNCITVGRIATGRVQSVSRTEDGGISVQILSFSQVTDGDKLGSKHGQKGLVKIWPVLDLPIIVMGKGDSFTADVYMSPASIIARQTHGMVYESGASWRAARDGKCGMNALYDMNDIETEECKMVLDPHTGIPISRRTGDGKKLEPIVATVGMIRMIIQTQTTREKHHMTHGVEGKRSLNVIPGRGHGGGVSRSEMAAHVAYGTGAIAPLEEMCLRENTISEYTCRKCFRIWTLCHCDTDEGWEKTRMRNGMREMDFISVCLDGTAATYVT
jgi:hypothetical protein